MHALIYRLASAVLILLTSTVWAIPTELTSTTTQDVDSSALDLTKRAEDCDWAKKWQPVAGVDCRYKWMNTNGDNFLNYVIKISGTGQRQDGWCDGLMDNIRSTCGIDSAKADKKNCGKSNPETVAWAFDYTTGKEQKTFGIDLNLHTFTWTAGEDNKACVANAIRKATCSEVSLRPFACQSS